MCMFSEYLNVYAICYELLKNLCILLTPNCVLDSENPDAMPCYAVFYQGLHCLLSRSDLQRETNLFLSCDYNMCPINIYTKGHPFLLYQTFSA